MSKPPGAQEILELIGQLQTAIRETAAQREQAERDLAARTTREVHAYALESRKVEGELAERLEAARAATAARRQTMEARHARRRAWLESARQRAGTVRLQRIEEDESRRKYKVQYGLLQASRNRDAGLAAAVQAQEQLQAALAQELAVLQELETRARSSFGRLPESAASVSVPAGADPDALLEELRGALRGVESALQRFRGSPLAALFRVLPLPVWLALIVLGAAGYGAFLHFQGGRAVPYGLLGGLGGGACAVVVLLYVAGRQAGRPLASEASQALARARRLHTLAQERGAVRYQETVAAVEAEFTARNDELNREWGLVHEEPVRSRESIREQVEQKAAQLRQRLEQTHHARLLADEAERRVGLERIEHEGREHLRRLAAEHESRKAALAGEADRQRTLLKAEFSRRVAPVLEAFRLARETAERLFPAWAPGFQAAWQPAAGFAGLAQFARLDLDLEQLAEAGLPAEMLPSGWAAPCSLPLMLSFPRGGSLLLETGKTGREAALAALNNVMVRLLATAPPSRLNFSLVDPVGLGQSFAAVTHLSDYGEHIINGRIWTQPAQIEKRLAELNEHMEKVIQMYLRNEYETIADYNEKAGTIAEKYHFLVVADFPAGFTEAATKRLLSIVASGARCGVFTLIHWDRRLTPPQEIVADDLRRRSFCLVARDTAFVVPDRFPRGAAVVLETPPEPVALTEFIHRVGRASIEASRVEVPFAQIAPPEPAVWSLETTSELRVPIGRTGATKLQYLAMGQGTRQHALVAGKTGSGKSTLFHVVITNLALWCSPEQVEFYLVDFKKGVEFQCYAARRLPHARVIAVESDREFGLSVLQRVDEELRRRGELFRRLGVQDIAGYKRAGGTEPVPRSLLIIDEFQEFFTEDDRVSQNAALLLDRIVRQGRAFGIHVFLGSQTLGGAYTLARATLGQMVIRIALQCNEADAYLIMDDNNPAPRLLSRPGEGIYNDQAGSIEGNSPFQTVWLSDDIRDEYLQKVADRARGLPLPFGAPIVFEGNAPADVRDNALLAAALVSRPLQAPVSPRIWLGAPNSIKGPTEVVFHRQSGNHLLLVGQREEAALSILAVGLVALAAQHPAGAVQLVILDGSAPGSPEREYLDRLAAALPAGTVMARGNDVEAALARVAADFRSRVEEGAAGPATFVVVNGLQKFKKLRSEDEFSFSSDDGSPNPARQLGDLITEGPAHGIHVIAVCDTYNNVNRSLSRKALGEFELRVLFQMSANDSASLIDSPKAGNLGLHRAIFYSEQEGHLEVFRPYALPGAAWVEQAGRALASS